MQDWFENQISEYSPNMWHTFYTISMNEINISFLLFLSPLSSHPLSFVPLLLTIKMLSCHPANNSLGPLMWHGLLPSGDGIFGFYANPWPAVLPVAKARWSFLPAGGILWCCSELQGVSKAEGRESRRSHKKLKSRMPKASTTPRPTSALPHLLHRGHWGTALL